MAATPDPRTCPDFAPPTLDAARTAALLSALEVEALVRLFVQCLARLNGLAHDLAHGDLACNRAAASARMHKLRGSCASLGLAALAARLTQLRRDLEASGTAQHDALAKAGAVELARLIGEAAAALSREPRMHVAFARHEAGGPNR